MANFDECSRKDVQKESADELLTRALHDLAFIAVGIVLVSKIDEPVIVIQNT